VQQNFPLASDTERVLELYPAYQDGEVRQCVAQLFGDTQFDYGARLLAQSMVSLESRTWRYVFTRRRTHRQDGPHHGQEVHYVFGNLAAKYPGEQPLFDETDTALSQTMMKAWVTFAATGDPNAEGVPTWRPFNAKDDNYLEFGDTVREQSGWRAEQLNFLEAFFEAQNAHNPTTTPVA